jgi:hypothetical protein
MNLLLHVCESKRLHVTINRFAFCSDLFARISSHVRRWIRKKKNAIFLSSNSVNHTMRITNVKNVTNLSSWRARTTKNEMCFFSWKKTFLAYDDVTSSMKRSFSIRTKKSIFLKKKEKKFYVTYCAIFMQIFENSDEKQYDKISIRKFVLNSFKKNVISKSMIKKKISSSKKS